MLTKKKIDMDTKERPLERAATSSNKARKGKIMAIYSHQKVGAIKGKMFRLYVQSLLHSHIQK